MADDQLAVSFSRISLVDPPIYSMPDDVLYQLFVAALASEPHDRVVRLTHVCSSWRRIIAHAPLLWRSLAVYLVQTDHSPTIEQFLRRSQDQLFDFTVHITNTSPANYNITTSLGPHAHRLRHLRVIAPTLESLASSYSSQHLSPSTFPALEQQEIFIQSNTSPGTFAVVSTPPNHLDDKLSALQLTALSFSYMPNLKLAEIFKIVETARYTLEHLKLYFQTGSDVLSPRHWTLMYGPPLELALLSSLQLGFNDALSLVPFMKRLRLPGLQSLSIHDFGMCPEQDTPQGIIYAGFALLHGNPPLQELLSTILEAIPAPSTLKALRLTGLYVPPEEPEDIIEHLFAVCGPHLRTLRLVECDAVFLEALAETLFHNQHQWRLERLVARGMDNDDLLECLWIRHAHEYPKLKELSLEPYTRPPPTRVLEQFAEVVNVPT